jgi:hypothetical protein
LYGAQVEGVAPFVALHRAAAAVVAHGDVHAARRELTEYLGMLSVWLANELPGGTPMAWNGIETGRDSDAGSRSWLSLPPWMASVRRFAVQLVRDTGRIWDGRGEL